jgi:divalent metal cation (Fe/Co/Zn/Cd) transporter
MKNKIFSTLFLLVGFFITLGAFGHSFGGVNQVIDALAIPQVPKPITNVIIAVWHFAGLCMVLFGLIIFWHWFRIRRGEKVNLFAPFTISVFYVSYGVAVITILRDPFFSVFVVLGGLLFVSTFAIRKHQLD